jgi:hypothetical protein
MDVGAPDFGPLKFAVEDLSLPPGFDGFIGYNFFAPSHRMYGLPGEKTSDRTLKRRRCSPGKRLLALPRSNGSLPVDLDIFFAAAVGNGDHDANPNQDRDPDQSPRSPDALQNTHFPECGQKAAYQDDETNKIHSCPFHDHPPDKSGSKDLQRDQQRSKQSLGRVG